MYEDCLRKAQSTAMEKTATGLGRWMLTLWEKMRASSGIKGLIFAYEQHPYALSEWSIHLNGSRLWSLRASSPRDQQGGNTICLMEGVFLAPGARNSTPQSVKWRVSGLWGRSLALTFGLSALPQNPTTLLFAPLS